MEFLVIGEFAEGWEEREECIERWREEAEAGSPKSLTLPGGHVAELWEKPGFVFGNTRFRWVFQMNGVKVALASGRQKDGLPVAKVEVSSLRLMTDADSGRAAVAEAKNLLRFLGVRWVAEKLFRVDACVDFPDLHVAEIVERMLAGGAVTRFRTEATFHVSASGQFTGVSIGRRDGIRFNCYDKLAELSRGRMEVAEAKAHVLVHRRWGKVPDCATRLEFQMRGTWLRARFQQCETLGELWDRLPAIMRYVTEEFFRLCDDVDRENKNQSRARVAEVWQRVQKAFADVEWGGANLALERVPKKPMRLDKMMDRAVTPFLKLIAYTPGSELTLDGGALQFVRALVRRLPDDWQARVLALREGMERAGFRGVFQLDDYASGVQPLVSNLQEMVRQAIDDVGDLVTVTERPKVQLGLPF